MAEPDLDEFAEEAEQIAQRLWDVSERGELPDAVLIQLSDVVRNLQILKEQLYAYRHFGQLVPCVDAGEGPTPIDVESLRGLPTINEVLGPEYRYAVPLPHRPSVYWSEFLQYLQEKHGLYGASDGNRARTRIEGIHPDDIGDLIRRPVTRFISNRLLGIFRSKAAGSHAMRIHFTINTKTPNLVMYYSGAYFIQHNNYFGAPSTPVTNTIPAGLYVFGGDVAQGKLVRMEIQTRFNIPTVLQGHLSTM